MALKDKKKFLTFIEVAAPISISSLNDKMLSKLVSKQSQIDIKKNIYM